MTRPSLAAAMRAAGVRLGALALVAAAAGQLAGCSQTSEDPGAGDGEDGVRAALGRIEDGLLDGDGALACSFLQSTAQRGIEQQSGAPTCPDAVAEASDRIEKRSDVLSGLSDVDVELADDTAVISGAAADELAHLLGAPTVTLSRYQGVWMVE